MSCISPSTFAGGQAVSCSSSTGYGGSPSSTTIRYISSDGSFGAPNLSVDNPMQVGVTGSMRQMVPVKYSIDQSPGSNMMSVTFQDYLPLQFSRNFVVLNDPQVNIPGGGCVTALGDLYHKPNGAPNVLDQTTLRAGKAPTIKVGNSEKKLGQEYIYYTGGQLAGAVAQYVGGQLSGLVAGEGLMNDVGSLLSIVQGIANKNMVELYADSSGKIDVKPQGGGGANPGNGCSVVSMTTGKDITCTKGEGGYAIYKHEETWRKKMDQKFKGIDLLGLPFEDCEGEMINLYKKDMGDEEKKHLERALKMGFLDSTWNNWEGFKTMVHLKRGAEDADSKAGDDSVDLINFSQRAKNDWGKNVQKKAPKKECEDLGSIPLKPFQGTKANKTLDKIYHCIKPLAVRIDEADLQDGIDMNFELNFKKGASKSKIAKVDPEKLDYMVIGGYEKLICNESDVEKAGTIADSVELEKEQVPGSQGEFSAILSELAVTVGRYYFMSGGGAGGGAGTITQMDQQARTYADVGGSFYWYHPKLDVRETVFRDIYLSLYGQFIKNANEKGGMNCGLDDQGNAVQKEAKHLSISQFLHLASKEKAFAMAGKGDGLCDGFGAGNGMDPKDIAAKQNKCDNQPKGIVIWDRQFDKISLPEQDPTMKLVGAGIEAHNDRFSNDVLRWFFEQLNTSVIVNPCKEEGAGAVGGAGGDGDCIDTSLDAWEPHPNWKVGEQKAENVDYTQLEPREYFAARAKYPPCQGVYNLSISSDDLSGKVLWKKTDCFGNILEWTEDFKEQGAVNGALASRVNEMYQVQGDACGSTTITTCGDGPANMPGGGAVQDFSVEFNEDGSVNTTYTVSGAESSITSRVVKNNAGNNQNNGRGGNFRGNAINNANDPNRRFRNPRTS